MISAQNDTTDVIIIGAGLSGIGAAVHLQKHCPGKSYLILEARAAIGGTWDLFRYPGIRSDSDMHTLGYNFKPWTAAKAIADGPSILSYVNETAREHGITPHIRYEHRLLAADWSDEKASWTLTVQTAQGEQRLSCRMLLMCSGYYNYGDAYTPEFTGREQFKGQVVHPQHWPEHLDYRGKKVAIIGSGATAMTLAPSMADAAASVTVIQRSPTYVVSRPDRDAIANTLRKFLPESWAYGVTRWKNVALSQYVYRRSRKHPEKLKQQLLSLVRKELGDDYDVEKHFTPRYNPWDQRLCLVPNADLFKSIKSGKTTMVTEHIKGFTEQGVELVNGQIVEADIIVTATGLTLQVLGGAQFSKNGKVLDFAETWSYKGLMFSGVPNMVFTFGYINASWTLRADLIAEFFCRLINEMDRQNSKVCTPELRLSDMDMPPRPFIDDFSAGYMQRMMHRFPKQGDRAPWLNTQNYASDRKMLRHAPLNDGVMQFH
ncbi:MAG: NAD(P)/FAD-dependent oxidoreductase [Pseudohongiella sp.]|nr:NAD(P)/FAD-dependent oxidoreductase [Pseudohongiella sp.]